MRRCPLCFGWHENVVGGCPPLEEVPVKPVRASYIQTENPPYVRAALESATAAREFLEVEKAAELLKAEDGKLNYKCRRCKKEFWSASEAPCWFCDPCIKESE